MVDSEPVFIAGAYEHPTREAPDKSTMQLHAEVARGALADAGLAKDDVDGYFTAGMPWYERGLTPLIMADYLGLDVSHAGTTDWGGSSYVGHVGHAADAIREGRCDVALITLAGRPRSGKNAGGDEFHTYQDAFEVTYGATTLSKYAVAAQRHMHEYGTTREQLAEIRVAASHHAQYNEHALFRDPVTVEDVVESRPVADPLHLLDCCVVTDGGGALLVVSEDVRAELERDCVEVLGYGEAIGHREGGRIDLTHTAARESGPRAFEDAGIGPDDVDYASIYDSFTITVLQTLEDLGFCEKGEGGSFVEGGTLQAPDGDLPFNTDGGGLCSNHPGNRGGMTKVIEAVRQLRGEANDEVQVDADVAIAHGTGGSLGTRHGSITAVLGREDR
ncbi:thiolase domain-containing protein [Natronolimnohabitans innermongolicus]|uniref:Acetyl-CoA acetyltransferase n=1 Tax=Natronolimnohabitans innermongolicus JCM 12255 TaxID=1227499 RepID=L9WQ41_9EURY|nr:thiolase domain-containing protein [Natronolimnohabitans innermongolicus]ELY50458.1 acetyl-CoA acetyltransferase [Natronolimnohabitans innermongolicus JCM 12255]